MAAPRNRDPEFATLDRRSEPAGARRPDGRTDLAAAGGGPTAPDIRDIELLAHWLDTRFSVLGVRFGLDSLIGLIPGIGDAATTIPAAYILLRAWRLGVPKPMLARMGLNVGIDLALGAIPLVGDLVDVGFKANRRNVALLRQHFGQPARTELRDPVQGSV